MLVGLSDPNCQLSDNSTFKLIVTAEVKRGYAPIIGSNVEVQAGSMPWKRMRDDGIGRFRRFLAIWLPPQTA